MLGRLRDCIQKRITLAYHAFNGIIVMKFLGGSKFFLATLLFHSVKLGPIPRELWFHRVPAAGPW